MWVDRHNIALLLRYSSAQADEVEVKRWLTVLYDRASGEAREEFGSRIDSTPGDYPLNAVKLPPSPTSGLNVAVQSYPPAAVLILGEQYNEEVGDPKNALSEEDHTQVVDMINAWDVPRLLRSIGDNGWAIDDSPVADPEDDSPEDDSPVDDTPINEDSPEDESPVDDGNINGDTNPGFDLAANWKLYAGIGGAVAVVGIGAYWYGNRKGRKNVT